jgi:hypothetical protein
MEEAWASCRHASLEVDEASQLSMWSVNFCANLSKQKPEILALNQNKVFEVK